MNWWIGLLHRISEILFEVHSALDRDDISRGFIREFLGCFVRYGLGADPRDPTRNVYRVCHIDGE